MNVLQGVITGIESSGGISLVEVMVEEDIFSALMLDTSQSAPYLHKGNNVAILFKETEVAIGKGEQERISIRNIFSCRIAGLNVGEILSDIRLDYRSISLHSIITTKSAKRLALKIGDDVVGMVKSNEIMLKPL